MVLQPSPQLPGANEDISLCFPAHPGNWAHPKTIVSTCDIYLVTLGQPSLWGREPKSIRGLVGENELHHRRGLHFTSSSAARPKSLIGTAWRKANQWRWDGMKLRAAHCERPARQRTRPASRNCQSLDDHHLSLQQVWIFSLVESLALVLMAAAWSRWCCRRSGLPWQLLKIRQR